MAIQIDSGGFTWRPPTQNLVVKPTVKKTTPAATVSTSGNQSDNDWVMRMIRNNRNVPAKKIPNWGAAMGMEQSYQNRVNNTPWYQQGNTNGNPSILQAAWSNAMNWATQPGSSPNVVPVTTQQAEDIYTGGGTNTNRKPYKDRIFGQNTGYTGTIPIASPTINTPNVTPFDGMTPSAAAAAYAQALAARQAAYFAGLTSTLPETPTVPTGGNGFGRRRYGGGGGGGGYSSYGNGWLANLMNWRI